MAGFLLYIPGKDKPAAEHEQQLWKDLGVWDFFDTCGSQITTASKGPIGSGGIIVAPQCPHRSDGTPATVGWYPDKQTWVALDDPNGIHVGFYFDNKPKPKDLKRPRMFDGEMITLGDGNDWQIPIIHMPNDKFWHSASTLPQAMYRVKKDNGAYDVETKVKADYLEVVEQSNFWVDMIIAFQDAADARKAWEALPEEERKQSDPPPLPEWATAIQEFDWMARVLKVNYRIMPRVIEGDVLGVASTDVFFSLLHASLGVETAAKN